MKKIVRLNTFETNSSSSHSLTWCTEKQFEDWKNGKLYVDEWSNKFYTQEEYDEMVKGIAKDNNCSIEDVLEEPREFELPESWDDYYDRDLEIDYYKYTTEHGDKIVAVCRYGQEY